MACICLSQQRCYSKNQQTYRLMSLCKKQSLILKKIFVYIEKTLKKNKKKKKVRQKNVFFNNSSRNRKLENKLGPQAQVI